MSIASKLKKADKAWQKVKDDTDDDFERRPDGKYKGKFDEFKIHEPESGNVLLIIEGKATEGDEKGKRLSGVFLLVNKKGDMNEWGVKLGRRALMTLGAKKIEGLEDFETACKKLKKDGPVLARVKLSTKEGSDFQNFSVDKLLGDDDASGSASESGSGSESESGSGSEESSASESESESGPGSVSESSSESSS